MQNFDFKPLYETADSLRDQLLSVINHNQYHIYGQRNFLKYMQESMQGVVPKSYDSIYTSYGRQIKKYQKKSAIGRFFYRIFIDSKIEYKVELSYATLIYEGILTLPKSFDEAKALLKMPSLIEENLTLMQERSKYIDLYEYEKYIEDFNIYKVSFNLIIRDTICKIGIFKSEIKHRLLSPDNIKYKVSGKLKEAYNTFRLFNKNFDSYTEQKIDFINSFIKKLRDTNYNYDKKPSNIDDNSPRKQLADSLSLSTDSSDEAIKKSYKKFILTSHPDKLTRESKEVQDNGTERFKHVTNLMEICGLQK